MTRDYVPNISDPDRRKAMLLPWIPCDLKHISYQQSDPGPKYFSVCMFVFINSKTCLKGPLKNRQSKGL